VTEAAEMVRASLAGVPPEPPATELLVRVRDGLRNLPAPPAAWLVHVTPDGRQDRYPLGLTPVYKGATTRDGQPMAGSYLGTSGGGYVLLEVTSAAWCEDLSAAVTGQQAALRAAAARDEAAEGGEAA